MLTAFEVDEILLLNRSWGEVYYGHDSDRWEVYILCFLSPISPPPQRRTRILRRKRPPLLAARPAIQLESTCFPMRLWIPYTKPMPMFLTKRFRKLGWGSTRSVVKKNYTFLTGLEFVYEWYLIAVQALVGLRSLLLCLSTVPLWLSFFACFSDFRVFVCPLSTYEQGGRWLWPSCKVLFVNILYPVQIEYQFYPPLLSLAMGLGFSLGVLFWGFSSDI